MSLHNLNDWTQSVAGILRVRKLGGWPILLRAPSILYQWNYTGEVCFQRPQDTDELSLADQAAPLNGAADDLEPHRW
ncbi:hypothetical protein GCM10017709_31960 [Glutamicibacter nicotianae]|uniref:Uncharacterized protein n=1 Tax=Glutamicibacter nicotianae TaxID=37929 RepID=A0ABQ0RHG0_GLUNI|nr:hypothetical protein ANI01nite_04730 [Glutamicibacter nicotianae]